MTTAPLLYVCVRPQQNAAAAEYESFRSAMRVSEQEFDRHDLVREPLPADALQRYRGFVVGGSPFNVADPESTKTDAQRRVESELGRLATAAATADGPAVLFTCYGIGVATRALGGTVSRAFPEDTGPVTIALTSAAAADLLFGGLADRFTALTAHKEGTETLPAGARLLATNDACAVQAYAIGDRLYATQFHPEPTTAAFTERMSIYRDDGYFEAHAYDEVAARVRASSITEPPRLLRAFAERFGASAS